MCPARAASYPLKTCETGEIFRMGKLTHPNYTISPRKMQTLPASRTGSASKFVKIPKPPTAENSRFRPNRGAQAEKFGNKLSARQGSSYSAGGDRAGVAVDIIISRIRRNAPGGHQGHRSGCGALQLITEVQVRHGRRPGTGRPLSRRGGCLSG